MAEEQNNSPGKGAADEPTPNNHGRGKPKSKPDYWLTDDGLLSITGWARDGRTNAVIAKECMGVNPGTLSQWIKKYPEIDKALQEGRRPIVTEIENAAFKAARGYWVEEEDKQVYIDKKGNQKEMVTKHKRWIKPDAAMAQYLLNNRKPDTYSARPDKLREALMAAENGAYAGLPAHQIAPTFLPLVYDIKAGKHSEYVLPGGRGSTKSSFISLAVIDILKRNPDQHAVILRQVGNTLADTVYNQILWAIHTLGLDDEWKYTQIGRAHV